MVALKCQQYQFADRGSSGDRSTGFYNALRRKFVWSIRASQSHATKPDGGLSTCSRDVCPGPCCIPVGAQPWGRWRGYVEGDSFEEASNWDDCHDDQCAITDVQNTPCDTRTQIRAW